MFKFCCYILYWHFCVYKLLNRRRFLELFFFYSLTLISDSLLHARRLGNEVGHMSPPSWKILSFYHYNYKKNSMSHTLLEIFAVYSSGLSLPLISVTLRPYFRLIGKWSKSSYMFLRYLKVITVDSKNYKLRAITRKKLNMVYLTFTY